MFVKFRQNFIKISKKNTNFHAFFMKFELNKLFNLFKNDKIVTTFLLKFWDLSGAKVWKSCRSRKSWKNEYLVAIVAVDTAENEPLKVWGRFHSSFIRLLNGYPQLRIPSGHLCAPRTSKRKRAVAAGGATFSFKHFSPNFWKISHFFLIFKRTQQ